MAEEKDKEKLEEQKEVKFDNKYLSESYAKKFIKTGLLAIGSSILFKGKNNELLKTGITAAAALALSDDKDYSKDAIVLASLFGVKNSASLGKLILKNDFDKFQKVYSYAEKADDILKNFNLASMNLVTKASETYTKNLTNIKQSSNIKETSSLTSKVFNFAKEQTSAVFNTLKDSASYLYNNGINKSLENISNNSFYNEYKNKFQNINLKELELISNDIKQSLNLDIKDIDLNSISSSVDYFVNVLTPDRIFTSKQEQFIKSLDLLKKYKKFQRIEESSFFTDMFGMYTKVENGSVNLRIDKILNERMHFADGLEKLAQNFNNQMTRDYPQRFKDLSSKTRTELFIDYLNENGFGELVEKAYKKSDSLTFGDVNKMFLNETPETESFLNSSTKAKTTFINRKTKEIKNIDILKDFSFTNVVRKGTNGFIDETALNGQINILQGLGAIEKNTVGVFKIPILDRVLNTWNPFKLIESDERIKNTIVNDIMGFHYNKQGYFLNGMRIAEENLKTERTQLRNGVLKKTKDYNIITYATNNKRDAKVIFNKNLLELLTEDYSVNRKNAKKHMSYSDIYKELFVEKNGVKNTFEKVTGSFINPFSFRYEANSNTFKRVKESEGYFKEGSFFSQYFKKADIDISKIRAENELLDSYIETLRSNMVDIAFTGARKNKEYREVLNNQILNYIENEIGSIEFSNNKSIDVLKRSSINNIVISSKKTYEQKLKEIDIFSKSFLENKMINQEEYESTKRFLNLLTSEVEINKGESDSLSKVLILDKDIRKFVNRSVSDKNSSVVSIYDDILRKSGVDETVIEYANKIQNAISRYDEEILKTKKNFNNLLHKNDSSYKNFVDDYNLKISFEDKNNIFNPLYEIAKAHTLNKLTKKELNKDFLEKLYEQKMIGYFKGSKLGNSPDYANTTLGSISQKIKDIFSTDERVLHTDSYKIFDKMEEEILENTNIKFRETAKKDLEKYTFNQLVDRYNKIKFTGNQNISSSAIIKKTEINYKNMKNILNNVRESIYDLLISSKDKNKELESSMNLLSKLAISNLQDTLEYIGIERLTQQELGNNGLKQIYNFMKYRYLPLAAIFGGAIAVDTFSDAIVPDDVPIIGNGISGVAIKGVAASRIGLQYALQGTGMLSLMRGIENIVPGVFNNAIGDSLDILMSPSEMIDVYFKGKPIEIKDNRWWFTAGRQSAQGEEFRQYRPHLWYIWQNKDSGIYSNKFEKLFRRDFALTKYPWYLLDPYKEEREAYEKYGAVYPMTEQLFLEVPVIGQFLNATIGEVIKPTQYIGEERWRVGDDMMLNPNYNPNDPSSPKYIQFSEPNKVVKSVFEAMEDLKTFAGLPGYAVTKVSEMFFGSSNPYQNEVALASIDQDTGIYSRYDELQLGDLFGMTEPIRRLIDDSNGLGMIKMNPLEQNLPEWMPEYFRHGNNPYMSWDFGNYILPGREFDRSSNNNSENEELNQFRVLSLTAPTSQAFTQLRDTLNNQINNFSEEEKQHYFESLSFAEHYGEREYLNKNKKRAKEIEEINLTIDKKISPYEFISNGKRYKLDTVTDNFNMLSERYGSKKATKMIDELNRTFEEGQSYSFKISKDASYAVGIDEEGDYFKIDSDLISKKYDLEKSGYRKHISPFSKLMSIPFGAMILGQNAPVDMPFEKIFGVKDVYNEWSAETVQAPFFRDWDSPVSSFLAPFYTYSSNYYTSVARFGFYSNSIYLNSNSSFNALGTLNKLGILKLPYNKLTGNITTSQEYKDETKVHDELEKIKFIAGDKSYFNMTGKEKLGQFSEMVNEQDAVFLKDLANVSNKEEREKILSSANTRLANVLKTIWNRHQMALDNTTVYNDIEQQEFNSVMDIGTYYGNAEEARNRIKANLGITLSKLDAKRQGVFNAYRGIEAEREADFIYNRMYRQYNTKPYILSTIYGNGIININKRGENY